jgi:hypothetical protein
MKRIALRTMQAAVLLSAVCLPLFVAGSWSPEPAGILTLTPVFERSCVAVRIPLQANQALSGVRWYNNDELTVFPNILVASGYADVPPFFDDGVVVAEEVGGAEVAWSEVGFSQGVVSETGTLYVIFQLPANQEGVESGIGPGFGHVPADSTSCVFLSADGDEWLRLVTDYQLLVDPVYTIREPGMVSLKCAGPALEMPAEAMEEEVVIARTELLRPYPNPFNPMARISFTLKNPGHVRLSVYDIRGRLVKDLENGFMDTGRYEIPWLGRDQSDQRVSSGVYFARLRADGQIMTQRLLLIK